jgi:hypothetical protein
MTSSNRIIPSQYELLATTSPPGPEEVEENDEEDGEDATNADAYDWR